MLNTGWCFAWFFGSETVVNVIGFWHIFARECFKSSKSFTFILLYFNLTEAINSTAMFFIGVAATLAVVLVVFGLDWFIKRRQASRMYTDVVELDTVELKTETAVRPSANNQVFFTRNVFKTFKNLHSSLMN